MERAGEKGMGRDQLLNLYTLTHSLTLVCVFSILFFVHFQRGWQGEFVSQSRAALVGDQLLYSHNFHVWFMGDIVRRNQMLTTLRGLTLSLPDQISNSPYCQPYNSYNVSSENLVSDQLIIPKLIFSLSSSLIWLILYQYCKEKFCLGHSWELKG